MSNKLSLIQSQDLLAILEERFKKNMHRHEGVEWTVVREKLAAHPDKLWSLYRMEESGGEPDIIAYDQQAEKYIFCDCSAESPKGRRSVCYDQEALNARKKNKPGTSAMDMAADMGIEILTEGQYRQLQRLGEFDLKTSSWVKTPSSIRDRGGAIFCDRRYDTVFMYHNGADSYYAARGFRGLVRV